MGRKKRILVADDSITIQKLVNITFAGANFEVILATDGRDCLVKLQRLRPDIVLLSSDLLDLPLQEIKEELQRDPKTHLIWMDESRGQQPIPEFVRFSLEKPFDAKILSNRVYDLLADEETTIVARPTVVAEDSSEEVTEKTQIDRPSGPFSSYRMATANEELSKPQFPAPEKIDLSSRLESIAKEVVQPVAEEEEENTLRVHPKDFVEPVNLTEFKTQKTQLESQSEEFDRLARSMISEWIETRLPSLAEQILKEEISKMARSR